MAQRAVGTRIQIGSNFIAELTEIGGLDISADTIDVTALDSVGGYKQFLSGFKDGGEVSLSGFFNPGDLGQAAIYTAFQAATTDAYTILFPSNLGASWVFNGVVTGFKTSSAVSDAISFEATIKVSGSPTLGLTPSANLTTLALTGTAGTLSPTFAGATYSYSYSFTGTNLTVTATLVAANINVYVDGVIFQSGVTSGSASNVITFSAVGTKKITVIENEVGKTPKIYDIVGIRTA